MRKLLWKTMFPFIIGIGVFGGITLFNQLNMFATTISGKYEKGYYIAWGLFIIIGIFMMLPVIRFLMLPRAIERPYIDSPADEKRKFYYTYKKRILKEYNKNKSKLHEYVERDTIKELEAANSIRTIKNALAQIEKGMDEKADKEIKKYAKAIFTATAISQNGTLDAIFILKLQVELIWKLACIYNQKPRYKEVISIYTGVLANALAATAISELSVQEVTETLIRQVTGGMSSVFTKGLSKIIDSVFDGTCNALLSLRVGFLAKDYCKYSIEFDEKASRKRSREQAIRTINDIGVRDTIANIIKREEE